MGEVVEKSWGTTECLNKSSHNSIHLINFNRGCECSIHRHEHRSNAFYVIDGYMKVLEYDEDGERCVRETILGPTEEYTVDAGIWHKFVAKTDGKALETYRGDESGDGIERKHD